MSRPVRTLALATSLVLAVSAVGTQAAMASDDGWIVNESYPGPLQTHCLMQRGTPTTGYLVGYIAASRLFQLGFVSAHLDATADSEPRQPILLFDGVEAPVHTVTDVAADMVLFHGMGSAELEDSIAPLIEASRVARVRGRGVDLSFNLTGVGAALATLRECDQTTPPPGRSEADAEYGSFQEEEEPADIAQNEPSLPLSSDAAKAKAAIGSVLGGAGAGGARQIAQFQCSISSRAFTGMWTGGGPEDETYTPITVGLAEDGTGFVNGSQLRPALVERGPGGELVGAAFAFADVSRAAMGGSNPIAALGTLTPEQNAGLQMMPEALTMMLGQAMGNRQRFMGVSVERSTVLFFDLAPGGGTANLAEPPCTRTQ